MPKPVSKKIPVHSSGSEYIRCNDSVSVSAIEPCVFNVKEKVTNYFKSFDCSDADIAVFWKVAAWIENKAENAFITALELFVYRKLHPIYVKFMSCVWDHIDSSDKIPEVK